MHQCKSQRRSLDPAWLTDLANGGAIVSREAAGQFICGRRNVIETLPIRLFSLGAQPSYGKDLAIFHNTLLQLAEKNTQP